MNVSRALDANPATQETHLDAPQAMAMTTVSMFAVFALLLGLTYSSTFFLPYALNDEQWIVRASGWWARFDVRQGRPLFSLAIFATSRLHTWMGFAVISAMRAGAVFGLAAAMVLLCVWMQQWNVRRIDAAIRCVTIASLPPFQIYVTDATWLVIPFNCSIAAMLLTFAGYRRSVMWPKRLAFYAGAAVLLLVALAFYQPAVLIAPAMLVVPLLSITVRDSQAETRALRFVMFAGALVATVVLIYYLSWLLLWSAQEGVSGGGYYSPTSVTVISVERLRYFFTDRLLQTLNLWYVDELKPTVYSYVTATVIALGMSTDLARTFDGSRTASHLGRWCRKYAAVIVVLVASDGIPLLASAPIPSYVTAPALFFVVATWAFSSLHQCLTSIGRHGAWAFSLGLSAVAVLGLFLAQYTVLTYFAVPLFLEYRLVRGEIGDYLKSHKEVHRVHVIGRHDSLLNQGRHEFGWSNATFDVYIRDMVKNALDDVGVPSEIEVTASNTAAAAMPRADVPPGDALIIDLSRIRIR